jgi:hypothetical protein
VRHPVDAWSRAGTESPPDTVRHMPRGLIAPPGSGASRGRGAPARSRRRSAFSLVRVPADDVEMTRELSGDAS